MNRKSFGLIPIVAGIIVLSFFLTGCQDTVNRGEEVSLRIGQCVSIEGEDLHITFAAVSGDSRCPEGAVCIWAGEVTCSMEIEQDDRTSFLDLLYPGLTDTYSELTYKNHTYTYKVEPYPETDETIAESEYRLILTVD
jgi:hypothetical protein